MQHEWQAIVPWDATEHRANRFPLIEVRRERWLARENGGIARDQDTLHAALLPQIVKGGIGRDTVEPAAGGQGCIALVPMPQRLDETLVTEILRRFALADKALQVAQQRSMIDLIQLL